MTRKPRLLILLFAVLIAKTAHAEPPEDMDATVEGLLQQGAGPGIAVGIVEDGKITLAKGYGKRELGKDGGVTPETLFEIGSTTKAFTSAALALLVDEGKIKWDDRVIDHLPGFQMHDPWVTREITIRDLLTHRSGLGLGAGDLTLIPHSEFTSAEMISALRHMKPQSSFRSTFSYNNLLYVAAGAVIENASGMKWEDFVSQRLFQPIGMSRSLTRMEERISFEDRAQAHLRLGPPIQGMGPLKVVAEGDGIGQNMAPAGAIISSVADMMRWVQLQLGHGKIAGQESAVWDPQRTAEMWSVVTPLPIRTGQGPLADAAPRFAGYALGWNVQDYQGERVVWHAGGTMGFVTLVVLLPDRDVGFVLLQNSVDIASLRALQFVLLDHYLGRPRVDWEDRFRAARDAANERAISVITESRKSAPKVAGTLSPEALAGNYVDAWFGKATLSQDRAGLRFALERNKGMTAVLQHYSGDTYIANWDDKLMEPAYVSFVPNFEGGVEKIVLKAVSPIADFSFDYHDLEFRPLEP